MRAFLFTLRYYRSVYYISSLYLIHYTSLSQVALSLGERSLPDSGSLYDEIAQALGRTNADPLDVRSVRAFYDKSGSAVDMDSTFFSRLDATVFSPFDPLDHDAEAARILDNGFETILLPLGGISVPVTETIGTGPQGVLAWRWNKTDMDIMTLYFPGPDNIAHGLGNVEPSSNGGINSVTGEYEVVKPVDTIATHAKTVTDAALGSLVKQIEKDGYSNAVLFAMTADHGQHQFKKFGNAVPEKDRVILVEELEPLLESLITEEGTPMKLFRIENTPSDDIVYSPDGGMGQFYVRSASSDEALNKTWQQPPDTQDIKRVASLLYREAVGHVGFNSSPIVLVEDDPAIPGNEEVLYEELAPVPDPINTGQFITNGAFGSPPAIFVRYSDNPASNNFMQDFRWVENVYLECDLRITSASNETASTTIMDAFALEFASKANDCAILAVEITSSGVWVVSGYNDSELFQRVEVTDANDSGNSLRDKLSGTITNQTREKDAVTIESAALISRTVSGDYQDIVLASIEEFLAARKAIVPDLDWPAFKERLDEMNNKNPNGSRTGDIITIMDGREGYVTVNYAEDSFPGWHGGPTVSESNVPLIFAMPGESFVDGSGNTVSTPPKLVSGFNDGVANAGIKADGHLRNWHLTPILREIITQFRDE